MGGGGGWQLVQVAAKLRDLDEKPAWLFGYRACWKLVVLTCYLDICSKGRGDNAISDLYRKLEFQCAAIKKKRLIQKECDCKIIPQFWAHLLQI